MPVELHEQHGHAPAHGLVGDLRLGPRIRRILAEAGEEHEQGLRLRGNDEGVVRVARFTRNVPGLQGYGATVAGHQKNDHA